MRISTYVLFFLSVLPFVSSCSLYRLDAQVTTTEVYPPKTSAAEVIYLERVRRPHKVIGTVIVNTERVQKMDSILEKLREEAALLGGDAITNLRTNNGTGKWIKIRPKLFENSNIRQNFIADVIVFR